MKKYLLLLFLFAIGLSASAQQRQKIAIFTPLFLDSAFDARGELKDRNNFPRYTAAGLEFYQGAQAALDSLNKRGAMLEAVIMDSKSNTPLAQQVQGAQLNGVQLIIGHTNAAETRVLAEAAARKKYHLFQQRFPMMWAPPTILISLCSTPRCNHMSKASIASCRRTMLLIALLYSASQVRRRTC